MLQLRHMMAIALASGLVACGPNKASPTPEAATEAPAMPVPEVNTQHALKPPGTLESSLSLINAKVRTPMDGRPTVGYLIIENGGDAPDRLVAQASPDFGRVELHDHVKEGDMVKMVKRDSLDLPAGTKTALEQGGLHLMLFDAKRPLKNGDSVKITLTFQGAGPIETNFVVLNEIPRQGMTMESHQGH
jgi:copper(I)-binding protein